MHGSVQTDSLLETASSGKEREDERNVTQNPRHAGVFPRICRHTFRATGITAYRKNGGTIEHA
jgi:hypothetical protein